jgi:hypothetical protein
MAVSPMVNTPRARACNASSTGNGVLPDTLPMISTSLGTMRLRSSAARTMQRTVSGVVCAPTPCASR